MKLQTFILIFIIFSGISCSKQPDASMFVQLKPSTFVDELFLEGEVKAVNSVTINGPARMNGTITYLVEDGTFINKDDTVCLVENKQVENYYETMLTNVENTRANYTKTKANLDLKYAMLRAELENIDAQTAISNLDSAQMQYLSPLQRRIKELELQKAKIQREKVQKEFDFLKPINEAELKKISLQIKQDSIRSLTYKEMLDDMVILSPNNGMVLREHSPVNYDEKTKVGDMTYPGYPILSIPDLSEVKVVFMSSETDYKRISVDDNVYYTFDGMPNNQAWGKIKQIAPMGRPVSRNSKIKEFEITASVDSFNVIPQPGLSANCRIVLKEIPDTIIVPQLAIFDEDSIKVVYALNGQRYNRTEVLIGASSPKEAVVIAGLTGTETLSFVKPASSKIKENIMLLDSIKMQFNKSKSGTNIQAINPTIISQLNQNIKSKNINQ